MIPKKIHYCWFGRNPKDRLIQKCIRSWKKHMPDYEIIEWNEDNFDIEINRYVKEAYQAKKWAFVSDYARLWVLKEYGGIYLDTDVEIFKSLDPFLKHSFFSGFENKFKPFSPIIGSIKDHVFVKEFLLTYEQINFLDNNSDENLIIITTRASDILINRYGIDGEKDEYQRGYDDVHIYPSGYFCLKSKNSYAVHHFNNSWVDGNLSLKLKYTDIKNFIKDACISIGRIIWYIYPKKFHDLDILFIFKSGGTGGSERVQTDILSVTTKYNTFTILTNKNDNGYFYQEYLKYTKVADISWISDNIIGRWIVAGYFQNLIKHSSIKLVFSSLSGLIYDISTHSTTKFVDIFHAPDGNLEYYSLRAVPYLDSRIVIDSNTKEFLEKLYFKQGLVDKRYRERIELIHNGVVAPDSYESKRGKKITILYVGRDAKEKRIYLIDKIAKKLTSFQFILVGVDDKSSYSKNMMCVGQAKDVEKYYKKADLLLITSEREGFPMVVMEAMSYGVIPVCTDVGGIKEHIVNGKTGFLVDNHQEESLIVDDFVKIIEKIDKDFDKREEISQNAYNYAKSNFDIKIFRKKYKIFFKKYLG